MPPLKQRDIVILQNAADGFRLEDAATKLGFKKQYVKNLAVKMYGKLGADNMAHAVALGFRRGLLR